MDIATVIGLLMGLALVGGAIFSGGGGLGPFLNVPSLMITVGGSFSALLINFPLKRVLGVFGVIKKCFLAKLPEIESEIKRLTELAKVARRDGLLALENELPNIDDPFLARGLELVIGGASKEELQDNLTTEISCIHERHTTGKKILDSLGSSAPAFGMIGTLIGLIQMLRELDDPSQIGLGMATALLTTLYGALLANLICIPLAGKLETRDKEEMLLREMMLAGLTALVEGQAPRAVEDRLKAFLSPGKRQADMAKAA